MKAVILLSGGMDSTTLASMACCQYEPENVCGISFDYGQKHREREALAVDQVSEALGLKSYTLLLPPTGFISPHEDSVLMGSAPMPHMTYQEIKNTHGVSPTYVPFRNATLISFATAFAMSRGAREVWFGAHAEDAGSWAYPDCTPEFIGAMANAVYIGTYHEVRLITPFMWLQKPDILKIGMKLGTPYHLTWSCYEGRGQACGKCPTCIERLHAFKSIGEVDPLEYEEGIR